MLFYRDNFFLRFQEYKLSLDCGKVSWLKFLFKTKTGLDKDHWIQVTVDWLLSQLTISPLTWLFNFNSLLKRS